MTILLTSSWLSPTITECFDHVTTTRTSLLGGSIIVVCHFVVSCPSPLYVQWHAQDDAVFALSRILQDCLGHPRICLYLVWLCNFIFSKLCPVLNEHALYYFFPLCQLMYERIPRKAKLPHVEMSSEILVQDMDYFVQFWLAFVVVHLDICLYIA